MPYTDFTLDTVDSALGVKAVPADLFTGLPSMPVPDWLQGMLTRGLRQALLSEKARSEFIVVPILLAVQESSDQPVAIYSGQRLDVDVQKGLTGECDFILSASPPLPALRAPILTIVEAKKNDIESGIGQCMAQMVAAMIFNERAGASFSALYGCVTTGETWQFLRLNGKVIGIDRQRYYIDNIGGILAVLKTIVSRSQAPV